MTGVQVVNLREVVQYLNEIPADTFKIAKKEIATGLLKADKDIKTNTDLMRRTGQLFKSIQTKVEGTSLKDLEASISTDSIYAPTHEYGATIRAIDKYMRVPGGPYLNIPTDSNKTPAGVTQLQAREVFNMGGSVVKFKSGKYGVMLNGEVKFTLHKQVKIKARLHMVKSAEDQIPTMLSRIAAQIGED
jgi:phage gpG-like protein